MKNDKAVRYIQSNVHGVEYTVGTCASCGEVKNNIIGAFIGGRCEPCDDLYWDQKLEDASPHQEYL